MDQSNRKFAVGLFLGLLLVQCRAQNYPGRQWPSGEQIDLTGQWYFKADPGNAGESAGWFRDETDKTYWPLVSVPVGFDNCGPGMERYFGTAWFCRNIVVPESFRDRRIVLHFEGMRTLMPGSG